MTQCVTPSPVDTYLLVLVTAKSQLCVRHRMEEFPKLGPKPLLSLISLDNFLAVN
jgi:hypothetical protein